MPAWCFLRAAGQRQLCGECSVAALRIFLLRLCVQQNPPQEKVGPACAFKTHTLWYLFSDFSAPLVWVRLGFSDFKALEVIFM